MMAIGLHFNFIVAHNKASIEFDLSCKTVKILWQQRTKK